MTSYNLLTNHRAINKENFHFIYEILIYRFVG